MSIDHLIAQLRRTLDTFPNVDNDADILVAADRIGHSGARTGLTWGDLRAIAERLGA
jgi:hypothetical protein